MSCILKFYEMSSSNNGEWPLNQQQMGDMDISSDANYAARENKFQEIQEYMKIILKPIILKKNPNADESDIEKVSDSFFKLGNNKDIEIRKIVDNCRDLKQCAKDIINRYIKYVKINFNSKDDINDIEQDSVMSSENRIIRYHDYINEGIINNFFNNIPEKHRNIFHKIKKAFYGKVKIIYIPNFKWFNSDIPQAVIKVYGENRFSGSRPFYCKRDGMPVKKFGGTVALFFYLDKNYQDIMNWLEESKLNRKISENDPFGEENWDDKPKKDSLNDFLDNFDAYQGEGTISPTKEVPYEFIDFD